MDLGQSQSDKKAIVKTLQSCHQDLLDYLNFHVLFPRLNQAGVIPAESLPDFTRPTDTTHTKINNLIRWLQQCTPELFVEFISLFRSTADEAGEAHKQLATALQQAYEANGGARYLFLPEPAPWEEGPPWYMDPPILEMDTDTMNTTTLTATTGDTKATVIASTTSPTAITEDITDAKATVIASTTSPTATTEDIIY